MPNNLLPADFYRTSAEHSHPALVIMLTFTQLSVGAFSLGVLMDRWVGRLPGNPLAQTVFAGTLAILALAASVFHLGRPWLAWRAFLGLRTSWLSREAVAFGAFAGLGAGYGVLGAASLLPDFQGKTELAALAPLFETAAVASGLLGVFCSVMVYVATRRAQWSSAETGVRFFGTTLILGALALLSVCVCTAVDANGSDPTLRLLLWIAAAATTVKLIAEVRILSHVKDKRHSPSKHMAILMLGDLRRATLLRFSLALLGGLLLPIGMALGVFASLAPPALLAFAFALAAELAERYLFFRAAPGSRMPGALR